MTLRELHFDLGRDALDRLDQYVSLIGKWRKITNLIADDSYKDIWDRHILDAIRLQRTRPQAKVWLDIGSGAGLPSVIIAILLADVPNAQIHGVEIDRRKCSFLREVVAKLAIPMKVHNALAEKIDIPDPQNIEIVTARAFSTIERILKVANPFLSAGAAVVLPRGRQAHDEVARLDHDRYRVEVTPNSTRGDGAFVHIELRVRTPNER